MPASLFRTGPIRTVPTLWYDSRALQRYGAPVFFQAESRQGLSGGVHGTQDPGARGVPLLLVRQVPVFQRVRYGRTCGGLRHRLS